MVELSDHYHPLEEAQGMHAKVYHAYDYVRFEMFVQVPLKFCAYIDLSDNDIDWLITELQKAKASKGRLRRL